jgi:hypothetical protein
LYGNPSPQLLEGARIMMPDVEIKVYSFLKDLSEGEKLAEVVKGDSP